MTIIRQCLELSIALSDNIFTKPILEGVVQPEGVRLLVSCVHPSEMFWRQLHFGDFDISEMSLSSLMIAVDQGDRRWLAVPIYTMRRFFHTGVLVRRGSGIARPMDLTGMRIGVPEYQQTSAIWSRGILEHYFDVNPTSIEWFMERGPNRSHGSATHFRPPPGIRLNQIADTSNIGAMLSSGELDATLLYLNKPNLVDRAYRDISAVAEPLFKDPAAEGRRFYQETGLHPINHTVVLRRELVERHPWIPLNLFNAFEQAKKIVRDAAFAAIQPSIDRGWIDEPAAEALRRDPQPYGVSGARHELETIARYVHEQGLTTRPIVPEELFAPSTLQL